jgi:hypothetical protein
MIGWQDISRIDSEREILAHPSRYRCEPVESSRQESEYSAFLSSGLRCELHKLIHPNLIGNRRPE